MPVTARPSMGGGFKSSPSTFKTSPSPIKPATPITINKTVVHKTDVVHTGGGMDTGGVFMGYLMGSAMNNHSPSTTVVTAPAAPAQTASVPITQPIYQSQEEDSGFGFGSFVLMVLVVVVGWWWITRKRKVRG